MKDKVYRPHPVTIVTTLWKYIIILIIPLLRGFLHALRGGMTSWLEGAWMDILLILLYLSFGVLTWYFFTMEVSAGGLKVNRGILIRNIYDIPRVNFTCITVVKPFYLKPIRGVYFRIDTPGGSFKKADLTVVLRKKDCEEMLPNCIPPDKSRGMMKVYKPKGLYVFILSAITSNSFAGVVFISTFISQVGEILGGQFSEMIYGTFEETAKALAFGIPPAAAAVAYILLFGYLSALVLNLFRHAKFSVRRCRNQVKIDVGLFTNRTYIVDREKINYIDIRRTLMTAMLGLYSVFLHTVGFGKYKDDISALIPCANKKQLKNTLALLLPEYTPSEATVKPSWKSFFYYANIGLWTSVAILAASVVVSWIFPGWSDIIRWGTLFCICPALWYLAVQIYDLFTAGISYKKDCFTLRYARGFYIHRVVITRDKVATIRLTQSIFQKWNSRCNLHLYSYSEGSTHHYIRELPQAQVVELMRVAGLQDVLPDVKQSEFAKIQLILKKHWLDTWNRFAIRAVHPQPLHDKKIHKNNKKGGHK